MKGRIHSIETFGTVDGPGVRFVVFFQGCPMRCKYCHNPDTWNTNGGTLWEASSLLDKMMRNIDFYSDGGLTVSGGEAMIQMDFLIELFTLAKEKKIHTCLDTSGIVFQADNPSFMEKCNRLFTVCDLVLLDIKHADAFLHRDLTGYKNDNVWDFLAYLENREIPVWIRHVLIPNLTQKEEYLRLLGQKLKNYSNITKIEVLAYHTLGVEKYEQLGLKYPLKDVSQVTKEEAKMAEDIIKEEMNKK